MIGFVSLWTFNHFNADTGEFSGSNNGYGVHYHSLYVLWNKSLPFLSLLHMVLSAQNMLFEFFFLNVGFFYFPGKKKVSF